MRVGVTLVVGLLCAPGARAAGEATLERVEALHGQLDYAGVVQEGEALLARGGNVPAQLRRIYELVGRALVVTGQEQAAAPYFRRLLALDPDYQLGDDVSPKIRAPLVRVLARWAGRPGLTVTHRPPDRALLGKPVALTVHIVADPERMVHRVRVAYRMPGAATDATAEVPAARDAASVTVSLPAARVRGTLRYSLEVLDVQANVLLRQGTEAEPLTVPVVAPPPQLAASRPVATAASLPAVRRAATSEQDPLRRWRYGALGTAAACTATAAVLYAVGLVQGNEAHDNYRAATEPADILYYGDRVGAAEDKLTAGHVVAGVAAVAAAITVYLFWRRPARSHESQAFVGPGLGRASVALPFD